MALTVILNGRGQSFEALQEGATLTEVISQLGLKFDRVAVERNGEIVARSTWDAVQMSSGDRLEVVHFVGGGAA